MSDIFRTFHRENPYEVWLTVRPLLSRGATKFLFVVLGFSLHLSSVAIAATIYTDGALSADCLGTYNATTRSCGTGTTNAYNTIQEAVALAQAGDTVLIRTGTYAERLIPPRSGTVTQPITIKSYAGETATIANVAEPALFLLNRSHLIIEDLAVTNVAGWARIETSSQNIIRGNRFSFATSSGTTGGFKLVKATYNKFLNNVFEDGNDNMVVQESGYNVVQGNTFTKGRHSLLSIRCGNFNVIRNNHFHNVTQKAAEIYDCEGISDAPIKLDATKHNLFELNTFAHTLASDADHRYNGIQFAGQVGLVRKNIFSDNHGGGLKFAVYADEALYNYRNRIFNNTFYNNRCHGLSDSNDNDPSRYYGNRVENNLFYKNVNCSGNATQMNIVSPPAIVTAFNNALATSAPGFVDEATLDLRLAPGSPMIDAGAFLTQTTAAGNGTQMSVADAGYFFDGHGIAGEMGDLIQLQGQTQIARVVAIDYATNTLTLSSPLTWTNGLGLHLAYTGSKPDMGALEVQGAVGSAPSAPSDLVVQ